MRFILGIDKTGQLRYYKYVLKRSTDLTKGDGLATVALFLFSRKTYNKKEGSTAFGVALFFYLSILDPQCGQ